MVHWPEVMMTYEATEKILFAADGVLFRAKHPRGILQHFWYCRRQKHRQSPLRILPADKGITYNGDLFPCMRSFIEGLTERNYQNRKVAIIENGTWAPMAGKLILGMFEKSKNLTFTETTVSVKSAMNEQNKGEIGNLAEELC